MKTAKKLFSLLLVAVLLMSAIPFQVFATQEQNTDETTFPHVINFWKKDMAGASLGEAITVTATKTGDKYVPASVPSTHSGYTLKSISVGSETPNLAAIQSGLTHSYFRSNGGTPTATMFVDVVLYFEKNHECTFAKTSTVANTCTTGGYDIETCTDATCGATRQTNQTIALGHEYSDWAVVTAAQVGVKGLERRTCSRANCPDPVQTREIPALDAPKYTVTFYSAESGETFTREWEQYKLITELPAPKDVRNKRFDGWYTQTAGGERIQVGNTWSGQHNTYYARFIDSVKDNVSNVSVFVRFYSEGIQQGETIFLDSFELTDNDKLLSALQARQSAFATKIYNIKSSNDYLWNESFYMYASGEKITDSDMRINGDTSILLKVDAKKSAKANVLLYVHNKAGEAATRLYEMNGYTAGNTVTASAVQNFLKAQTGKTYTISGLYDQDRWEQLANGQKPTAAGGLDVPASGTLKIHVILSNFSSGTSSKPASNPSTGDPIMATAGIMVLAAAALVSILELRKRKMI